MPFWRKEPEYRQPATRQRNQLPDGWHEGVTAAVHIVRRQASDAQQGGWDLIDSYSNMLIQEFMEDELTDLFKSLYNICYNNAIEMLKLFGEATPEHEHSATNSPIAMMRFDGYTILPQSIKMTEEQAMASSTYKRKLDTNVNATQRMNTKESGYNEPATQPF